MNRINVTIKMDTWQDKKFERDKTIKSKVKKRETSQTPKYNRDKINKTREKNQGD